MKTTLRVLNAVLFLAVSATAPVLAQSEQSTINPASENNSVAGFKIQAPKLILADVPFELSIQALDASGAQVSTFSDSVKTLGLSSDSPEKAIYVPLVQGFARLKQASLPQAGYKKITVQYRDVSATTAIRVIPGLLSLLPPLFAITLAFVARQVLISLFSGIWLGAIFINDYGIITGFMRTIDGYIVRALANPDQASILIFSMTLGGMVGVISRSGGTQGIVEKLSKFANNSRGGQLATWAMGLLIFFDDYANTLVVGNTMRPFTDKLRISREKLSYIVDSTAAPVASIALVSTWVGFQVGLIDQAFVNLGLEMNAYNTFLQSIPHSTYSILALIFVFVIAVTLRDFGPMRKAEMRAIKHGKVLRDGAQPIADSASLDLQAAEDTPKRWYNAIIPISLVIIITLVGLYVDGKNSLGDAAAGKTLGQIFGAANSFHILMWASFTGLFVASLLAVSQKLLSLNETVNAAISGYKSMLLAAMILVLAWSMGNICKDLHTADYVIAATRGILSPHFIPVVTFLLAAFISFSTGSSWATMAILTPIVVPIAVQLPLEAGITGSLNHDIILGAIGAILSGSVLGDHCSPISDTTILSSMASAADHVDHVKTQLPYALAVGFISCLVGYIPTGWGFSAAISLLLGTVLLVALVRFAGKKSAA